MRKFFRSWKRKLGVVTLLIACVFAGGWARSFDRRETIAFRFGEDNRIEFGSNQSQFTLALNLCADGKHYGDKFYSSSASRKVDAEIDARHIKWQRSFGEFMFRRLTYLEADPSLRWYPSGGSDIISWTFPYWSIVIPLTLLSAWLLLSKPRQPKQVPE